jgi:pyridoxal phosphate enzyme (YggS family)
VSAPVIDETAVAGRVAALRQRIERAGGRDVRVVAVTKGFPVEAWAVAQRCGLDDVAESYAQELAAKLAEAPQRPPRLHFIGRLQTNKVRSIAAAVDLWQSVDREHLVVELARRSPAAHVLVQVNVSGEPTKGGCPPEQTGALVARCRELGLEVDGLMAVGATGPPEQARSGFALLAGLADRLGLRERSMGMTDDLEVAVSEGATMVRVGTALFGRRPLGGPTSAVRSTTGQEGA